MRTREIANVIEECVTHPERVPLILHSSPGVGKSDLVCQAAARLGWDYMVSYPGTDDPTDIKGFGGLDYETKTANFYPYGNILRAIKAEKPTIWCLEDFIAATQAVQAGYGQPVMARQINGMQISDNVAFVINTNARQHKSGGSGVLEMFKGRCVIAEVTPHADDWAEDFAMPNGINPVIIAYMLEVRKPNHTQLCDFKPTTEMTNSPSPRTWYRVHQIMQMKLSRMTQLELMKGAIGEGLATEFFAYSERAGQMPNVPGIILNPANAPIPEDISVLWATSISLAMHCTKNNFGQIVKYAFRLEKEANQSDFGVLIIDHCTRKIPTLAATAGGYLLHGMKPGESVIADSFRAANPTTNRS